jgi:hypothetical protein
MKGFADQIREESLKIMKGNERTMRRAAIAAFGMIIKETPVDKGRLRSNWFCSGSEGDNSVSDVVISESQSVMNMTNKVASLRDWSMFILTNNLPYAERIEYQGWSDLAPAGVVRVSLARVGQNIERGNG